MGGTHTLDRPGRRTTRSSSSRSVSGVIPARHSLRGFSCTVVSNISSGAGSVALSARPALPNTRATSGTLRIWRSVCCSSSPAFCAERPGSALGMYSRSPSSSGGRNSPPRRDKGHSALANTSPASTSVRRGLASAARSTGR
jgi:hypothetical protein